MTKENDFSFLKKCRSSFAFFVKEALGLELSEYHNEICRSLVQHRHNCLVLPRGHSKTTLCSVAFPIWNLWKERNFDICLTSGSLEQSRGFLDRSKQLIEDVPLLKSLKPEDHNVPWNAGGFKTSNGGHFYTKPFRGGIRGIHTNLLIADDVLRDKYISQDEIKNVFWGAVFPTVNTLKAQLVVVGTRIAHNDLLGDIKEKAKKSKLWNYIEKQAIITNPVTNEWIKPLWAERFSLEEFKEIKLNMGAFAFNREYMNQVTLTEGGLFQAENVLNCLDDNLGFTLNTEGTTYLGADFAMSQRASGDYSVFTVVDCFNEYKKEVDGKEITIYNPVVIRKIFRKKGMSAEIQGGQIDNMYKTYACNKIIADKSTFGVNFVDDLRRKALMVEGQGFQPTERRELLLNLASIIESGRLVIPYAQDNSFAQATTRKLVRELTSFKAKTTPAGFVTYQATTKHDDMVMSLAMACKYAGKKRPLLEKLIYT